MTDSGLSWVDQIDSSWPIHVDRFDMIQLLNLDLFVIQFISAHGLGLIKYKFNESEPNWVHFSDVDREISNVNKNPDQKTWLT